MRNFSEREESHISLKIVAVNEHEEPKITCASHTVILDDIQGAFCARWTLGHLEKT